MDVKLYMKVDKQQKQELESQIELMTELHEMFGIKEVTVDGVKVLGREVLLGRQFEIHLREPHGGQTLHKLFADGHRMELWVVYGESKNLGRKREFVALETYVIKHLLPHARQVSSSNHVSVFFATLDSPEKQ